jgi:hypothetical protein
VYPLGTAVVDICRIPLTARRPNLAWEKRETAFFLQKGLRTLNCLPICRNEVISMIVAAGLAVLVVLCLLLSMVQTPPAIGR